jgi:hypothetical protein
MIKVENIDVWGFEHAIRGMRNPKNSWAKSDSYMGYDCQTCGRIDREGSCEPKKHDCSEYLGIEIGPNDLDLMRRLYKAGSEHRKYLRQIFVSMDITAPLYWWKEFDTYKVGTVANSCSTMHKITSKPITLSDFSTEEFDIADEGISMNDCFINVVADCEMLRKKYLETNDKKYWRGLIQLLPSSYNQKRTVTMNYENAVTMIHQRTGHKLDEWNEFVETLKSLPYISEIMSE